MRPLDIRVFGLQACVAAINHARIVAQPYANLEQRNTRAGEQGSERVAHRVGRYPFQFLLLGVLLERTGEVVSVAIPAVFHFRLEHERLAQPVDFQERKELGSERNRPFLAILEIHRGSFAEMEQSCVKIEPKRTGFDNLVLSQTGVEAAEQDEKQVVTLFALPNEFIALLVRTEVAHPRSHFLGHVQTVAGIAPANSRNINTPVEKGTQDAGVCVGGGNRVLALLSVVERLDARCSHVCGGNQADIAGERFQDKFTTVGAGGRELVLAPFIGKKSVNLSVKRAAWIQGGSGADRNGVSARLFVIARFQADEDSFAVPLIIQPVNRAAQIDTDRRLVTHWRDCHKPLSHMSILDCGNPTAISRLTGERVTRLELATSSLARKLPVEGTVTLRTSQKTNLRPYSLEAVRTPESPGVFGNSGSTPGADTNLSGGLNAQGHGVPETLGEFHRAHWPALPAQNSLAPSVPGGLKRSEVTLQNQKDLEEKEA